MIRRARDQQPMWFRVVTAPLAWLMQIIVWLRTRFYEHGWFDAEVLLGDAPVISVGNIVVGGTGKTPVVIALAAQLTRLGQRPAVLTRGYGSSLGKYDAMALLGGQIVMSPKHAAPIPDEARLQSFALPAAPIVIGRRRADAARRFLVDTANPKSAHPSHWLLDDGFQHRRLKRRQDIVLIDAESPFGNGMLLPAGVLREPPEALARATAIFVTRCDVVPPQLATKLGQLTKAPVFAVPFRVTLPAVAVDGVTALSLATHSPAALVAALAQPARFERDARRLGVQVAETMWRQDHARFLKNEVLALSSRVRAIFTTGKDYWRDPTIFTGLAIPVFVIELNAAIPEAALKHCKML